MSASERRAKEAQREDRRFVQDAMNGLRQALATQQGRAFVWWLYSENAEAEGKGGKGRRVVAREVLRAARIADFEGLQAMRQEHEQPKLSRQEDPEADAPEGDE